MRWKYEHTVSTCSIWVWRWWQNTKSYFLNCSHDDSDLCVQFEIHRMCQVIISGGQIRENSASVVGLWQRSILMDIGSQASILPANIGKVWMDSLLLDSYLPRLSDQSFWYWQMWLANFKTEEWWKEICRIESKLKNLWVRSNSVHILL